MNFRGNFFYLIKYQEAEELNRVQSELLTVIRESRKDSEEKTNKISELSETVDKLAESNREQSELTMREESALDDKTY